MRAHPIAFLMTETIVQDPKLPSPKVSSDRVFDVLKRLIEGFDDTQDPEANTSAYLADKMPEIFVNSVQKKKDNSS